MEQKSASARHSTPASLQNMRCQPIAVFKSAPPMYPRAPPMPNAKACLLEHKTLFRQVPNKESFRTKPTWNKAIAVDSSPPGARS